MNHVLFTLFVLVFASCIAVPNGEVPDEPVDEHEDLDEPSDPEVAFDDFALRGNPDFDPDQLSSEARVWYDLLWFAIENEEYDPDAISIAEEDGLHHLGRSLNQHITALLLAFRATGDLRFLDEVDRFGEILRGRLTTVWIDHDGNEIIPDDDTEGFRRLLYLRKEDSSHWGRDTHSMNDQLTHANIAHFTYAYHNNRDLTSPTGIDYGERADFWTDYLINDFEKKWRIRRNTPEGFPFFIRNLAHPYAQFARWHHYMYLITGDGGYADERDRRIDSMIDELVTCPSDVGMAYIWSHGVQGEGSSHEFLQPINYALHEVSAYVDFIIEDANPHIDAEHMQRLANTWSQFVNDGDPDDTGRPWAGTVGGQEGRCGLFARSDPSRRTWNQWARGMWGITQLWDETGEIAEINADVYERTESDPDRPERIYIPTIKLLDAVYSEH